MSPARTARCLILAAIAAGPLVPLASAQEVPVAAGAFKGFDGISAECIVHTPDKFAQTACETLFKEAAKQAGQAEVTLVKAGVTNWEGVPVEDRKHVEPPTDANMAKPLRLTFFIRAAQSDRITGGYVRAALWVPAETGKLVLWEAATLGTGPRKGLRAAIIKDVTAKLERPFTAFAADNKEQ